MTRDISYEAVMARKNEIMKKAVGIDYQVFESGGIAFDYERMMREVGYTIDEIRKIQAETGVGNTPLIELKNLTKLARKLAPPGKGARIFIKDEACNPSGSFKDRRASVSVYRAQKLGFKGVIAATSGNYGAAVASQAAMRSLNCIVVQEVFDSEGRGQPEILEKGRKCEAFGAEVIQLSVGPELFYTFLCLLEETGYFNASLYTPFGIAGIETLGYEVAEQVRAATGRDPDAVVITHAGGGNVTGTARGLLKAGCRNTKIIGASVDLTGLHMASDRDFNRKSFTTGHTGFGVPFATWPDRADVPRNAARSLRYLDRYVTVSQGEVFYMTEALAQLEGMERGPAGNTSLAAAFAIAREMDEDQVIVVQETEYTGAGKLPSAQLTFATEMGVEVRRGDPAGDKPGERIVIPEHPAQIRVKEVNLDALRKSYISNCIKHYKVQKLTGEDIRFLAEDTKTIEDYVRMVAEELGISI
ncbi:cysteine synthase [Thermosediminibacter litoriperuensis]|uniref:Cysteine synthase n=2 Tax=Thermosediminibacter litoriperuensis TaxID=291989 RepID=A0A5S5AXB1_9FIRM|nr:2-amino-4-oxopentanoate thiolase subunit OrtB [Thermosediminibacter litoriperuensis]TYP58500.1 cysteine synthase [Thermosediminibacter litoriperuensis]